jgi:Ca2+:H+ antiporter
VNDTLNLRQQMSTKNIILFVLLLFIPVSVAAHFLEWGEIDSFHYSWISNSALSSLDGYSHRRNCCRSGAITGGLVKCHFWHATELIIALVALNAGLIDVVKASITDRLLATYY